MGKMKKSKKFKNFRIAAAVIFAAIYAGAWFGLLPKAAELFHVQFGPSVMNLFCGFSVGALLTTAAIALLTFVCGRFYCAFFCPMGIWQDFVSFVFRTKRNERRNFQKTRYVISGIAFGALAAGSAAVFMLLDPYSLFGRFAVSFTIGASVPVIVIGVLAVWKKRIFCTSVCPVGTLLGLFAKKGVFRLKIKQDCVKCGGCAKVCPSGCIDSASGTIDNERCVRCMDCMAVCPKQAIVFAAGSKSSDKTSFNASRRLFLSAATALAGGAVTGIALAKSGMMRFANAVKNAVLPPGAGDVDRFSQKCTDCRLCVKACPEKIIRASSVTGHVTLDLSKAACRFDCRRCTEVCPTGALKALSLAKKQSCKIADAKADLQKCIKCGLCSHACPVRAITFDIKYAGERPPVFDGARCIGCGACTHACPVDAISIFPVEKQTFITKRS